MYVYNNEHFIDSIIHPFQITMWLYLKMELREVGLHIAVSIRLYVNHKNVVTCFIRFMYSQSVTYKCHNTR